MNKKAIERRASVSPTQKSTELTLMGPIRPLQIREVLEMPCLVVSNSFMTPWTVACQAPLSLGFPPGKNIGVGCHFLLQGIFQTQGSNLQLSPKLTGGFFTTESPAKPYR